MGLSVVHLAPSQASGDGESGERRSFKPGPQLRALQKQQWEFCRNGKWSEVTLMTHEMRHNLEKDCGTCYG